MYKQIVIASKLDFNNEILKDFDYLIIDKIELNNTYSCKYNDEIIDFDYLIIDNKISKKIMSEDGFVITNNHFETSVDNYFAIGNCVRSDKTVNEQLEIIIEYIKGN